MENALWLFAVGIGPFLLLAVIIYAVLRQRRLSAGEKRAQENEIRREYDKPSAQR
ncbi:MAG: hypothetical protein QHC90_23450 [Shinella sp.]|nr:hypothetical protein [Shinella sp.]